MKQTIKVLTLLTITTVVVLTVVSVHQWYLLLIKQGF